MELEELPADGQYGRVGRALIAGDHHLPLDAPGVDKGIDVLVPVFARGAQIVENGVAEGIDLLEADGGILRQKAADLAEFPLVLSAPALGLPLAQQPGGDDAQRGAAAQRGKQQQGAEREPYLFSARVLHGAQPSAIRTWSPFFSGALEVVMT